MEEWKEYKIKDATSILGDGIHGTPKYDDAGPVFFINGNNLENGKIVIKDNTKRVSLEEANKHKKPLTERTLFVSINGTLGNVARYNGESCILGKSACYFNVKEEFDLDFIFYVVANCEFRNEIERLATGTTIKNVSLETMRNYTFYAPSLKAQKQIASILKALDDKIEVNKRINDNLEQQAQALFKSWFVDFEPFRNQPFIETELGMIPQGWKVGTLFDVAEIYDRLRKPLSRKDRENMERKFPYYGATSCMDYVDNYIFDGIYTLIGEDGSVIREDGLPYMQYAWGKFWVNNHAHILQGKNGFSTEMIHVLLSITNILHLVTGAVQAKLSQANMQKILLAIPPSDVLEEVRPIIGDFYEIRRKNEDESARLASLRDTLLPRLMSGELSVDGLKGQQAVSPGQRPGSSEHVSNKIAP